MAEVAEGAPVGAFAGLVLAGGAEMDEAAGAGMERSAAEESQLGRLVWAPEVRMYLVVDRKRSNELVVIGHARDVYTTNA